MPRSMAMGAPLPEESQLLSDPMGSHGTWNGDGTDWNGDGTNWEGDGTERIGGSTYWNDDGTTGTVMAPS